jgi:hypothetical protein
MQANIRSSRGLTSRGPASWVRSSLALSLVLLCGSALAQERLPSAPGAEAFILSPANGARVKGPVVVRFGLKGMGIAPAGVKFDNTGHFHLLIDTDPPTDLSVPMPALPDKLVHYGKGQIESAPLTLPPGKHTFQVVLADLNHVPFDPSVMSKKVTITVLP